MSDRRRVVTAEPENSETPLERVGSWVTPNRLFFVRSHFSLPTVDPKTWRLQVRGCVDRPRDWTLDELAALPERTVFATMECAGNGRSFLSPHMHGVQWGAGAIGHAEWTGIPLRLLLEQSGLQARTQEILFEGLDSGREADHPEPLRFARSLPLAKALDRDTLLVTKMNGEPLEPIHGFPLRLIVPGWYGVASVKWLGQIAALDHPFNGYYQSKKYTVQQRSPNGSLETVIVGPMAVKSEIIRPQAGETLGVGTNRLFGIAWAGEEPVAKVEVSTDGGKTWGEAERIGPSAPYSWTLWECLWEISDAGRYALLARATSASGRVQPLAHDLLLGGYHVHFARPREVLVASKSRRKDEFADLDALAWDMNAFAEENVRRPLDVELEMSEGAGI